MILGLDISTACIGYTLLSDAGKTIEVNYIKFKDKISKFEKLQHFIDSLKHIDSMEEKITRIAIEEPLKKFQGKFSNAGTIAVLNFFNGMISSYVYQKYGIEPIYFNVNNARATVFPGMKLPKDGTVKYEIWRKVLELNPLIEWKYGVKSRKLLDENFDASDSYVIAACMAILLERQGVLTNETEE